MTEEVAKVVVETLKTRCGVKGDITESSRLMEDLEIDSMGMLSLAVSLENHYKMELGEDPDSPPETVLDVVELVCSRLRERERA